MPRFRYDPTVPDAGSIGELIARQGQIAGTRARDVGNIQAHAALARGQAWGNAIGSIGDVMSRGIQGYVQQKQDAPLRALEMETAQTRLAGEKANLANQQATTDARAQLTRRDAAFVALFETFPDGNIPLKEIQTIYGPRDGMTIARGLQEYRALEVGEVEDPYQAAVRIGAAFKALKSPALQQAFWPKVQQAAVNAGLVTPEQLTPEYTDEVPDALIAWGSGKAPEGALKLERVEVRQPDGSVTYRWVQPSAGLEISGGTPPDRSTPNPNEYSLALEAAGGDPAKALELVRQQRAASQPPQAKTPDTDMRGLAELAARQPAITQSLTPGVQGQVLKVIANDPTLLSQFEQSRMAPLRAAATRLTTVLDDLVEIDQQGNLSLTSGARALYGLGPGRVASWTPGSAGANARAALAQVTGNLTLNLIAEAKAQSKTGATGFGQLSERELSVIESAASVLKGEISESRALQELQRIREAMQKMLQPSQSERGTGGVPGTVGDQTDALLDELLGGGR